MRPIPRLLELGAAIFGLLFVAMLIVENQVAANTLYLGLAVNLIAIPVGTYAARICLNSGPVSLLVRTSCLALLFVPLFVHVSAWDSAFGKLGWVTNSVWGNDVFSLSPWAMAIWIHAIASIPQVTVVFWFLLQTSGRVHEEQASLDATGVEIFWNITLPRFIPVIGLSVVWIFVTCAREIVVTDIYRIGTLAEQIYLGYSLGETDLYSKAATTTLMIATMSALVLTVTYPLANNLFQSSDLQGKDSSNRPNSMLQQFGGIVFLLLVVIVPLMNLIVRASRSIEIVENIPVARYTISNFVWMLIKAPSTFATELQWSILIAGFSTLISMMASIGFIWKAIDSRRWQMTLLISVAVCCSLPGPLIGSSVLWLRSILNSSFSDWMFDKTIFAPVLANLIFCWPISCLLNWFVLRGTPRDILEHARSEGASSLTLLFQIVIAGNVLALFGSSLVIFANCFGELSASHLAVPPGMDTVPRRMLGMLHSGVNDQTAGLTIVSVGFILAVIAIGYRLVNLNQRLSNQ